MIKLYATVGTQSERHTQLSFKKTHALLQSHTHTRIVTTEVRTQTGTCTLQGRGQARLYTHARAHTPKT